jgi:PIN domain nuclease of toxin-antitoxin system
LADACALLAFFANDGGLSKASYHAIERGALVSPITVFELTLKASLGRLPQLPATGGSFASWLLERGFRMQPLIWSDAERANRLPPIHKDPIDRMLIAQALNAGLPVITNDRNFAAYGVTTIW